MKQASHLPNLQELLQTFDLQGVPTLIIDDEGDQHSMNTKERKNARKGESNTSVIHQRIIDLRNCLPHHTLIQYTATPQAPLFVDIMNHLSPNFIQLLTPGPGYTGGKIFFIKRRDLVNVIDDIDPHEDLKAPPNSLVYAMQLFYLGVVKGMKNKEGKKRSMMIHPSQFTYTHAEYFRFAINIKNHFVEILNLPDDSPDKIDLLNEFRVAYDDLKKTTTDLPSFEELTAHRLRHAINTTVIQSLNSNEGNKTIVDWRNNYSFILIGGQAMDRGFTVEGLTITYMPRSVGTGNADTIQQRARFFGYKENYLGYCRVFLDQRALTTYIKYVEHEEDMRKRLTDHKAEGKNLNDWYREVFLSSDLNLSRTSVFSKDFERTVLGGEWNFIRMPQHSYVESNRKILENFTSQNVFEQNKNLPSLNIRLDKVYKELVSLLRYDSPADLADYSSLLYLLAQHLESEPDEFCTLFLMSEIGDARERSLNENDYINQLFQGRNANYPGDREILGTGITFQIHILNLLKNSKVVASDAVVLAAYIPEELGKDIIRWE